MSLWYYEIPKQNAGLSGCLVNLQKFDISGAKTCHLLGQCSLPSSFNVQGPLSPKGLCETKTCLFWLLIQLSVRNIQSKILHIRPIA